MARKHNVLTALLLSAAPAAASPEHRAPPPAASLPQALRDLRRDLVAAGRDRALAAIARFRPLCDQDGYPLVGNVASKGDLYQPSQFCAEVRSTEKRR
jgi:hypothetical protein